MIFRCLEVWPICTTADRRCHYHNTLMALSRSVAQFTIKTSSICADSELTYASYQESYDTAT
jgi:hypothetical protein